MEHACLGPVSLTDSCSSSCPGHGTCLFVDSADKCLSLRLHAVPSQCSRTECWLVLKNTLLMNEGRGKKWQSRKDRAKQIGSALSVNTTTLKQISKAMAERRPPRLRGLIGGLRGPVGRQLSVNQRCKTWGTPVHLHRGRVILLMRSSTDNSRRRKVVWRCFGWSESVAKPMHFYGPRMALTVDTAYLGF